MHTPGPWELNDEGDILTARGKRIATVSLYNGRANARLIAAAPELENVLNTLPPKTVRVIDGREYITFDYAEFANWDAGKRLPALAKATGI